METALKAGQVAARAGVNVETLRYYERRGIMPRPKKRASGYREYGVDDVRLVRFVKRAQGLGFTLKEIQGLLRLRNSGRTSCDVVRASAQAKILDVEEKIASLRAIRSALSVLVASCRDDRTVRSCPILEALETGSAGAR